MLTKSIAVSLPLVVLAHRLVARRSTGAASVEPLPWGLLAALTLTSVAGVAYRWLLLPPWIIATARQPDVTPRIYFQTQWSALLYYLRLFVWPDALVVDRLDYRWTRSLSEPRAWGSLLALVALGAGAWRLARVRLAFGFCALWVVITLAPESSFFPLAEAVNEHRPYLAMLGLATIAALALWLIATAVARRLVAPPRWVFAVGMTFVATLLAVTAHARTDVWRDDLRLWLDATEKAPQNPRAWLNAGHAALARGDLPRARSLLLEAHRLSPCYAYIQLNLSAVEAREGHAPASLAWADEAVRCNPGLALARAERAGALERLGRADEALAEYRATTAIDAVNAGAWLAQGRLLEARGDWPDAAHAFDRALAADPTEQRRRDARRPRVSLPARRPGDGGGSLPHRAGHRSEPLRRTLPGGGRAARERPEGRGAGRLAALRSAGGRARGPDVHRRRATRASHGGALTRGPPRRLQGPTVSTRVAISCTANAVALPPAPVEHTIESALGSILDHGRAGEHHRNVLGLADGCPGEIEDHVVLGAART